MFPPLGSQKQQMSIKPKPFPTLATQLGTQLEWSVFLPESPLFSVQPALWPTLVALALLSSVTEASLDPMSRSPAVRDGPSPVLAPPTGHLPGR